MFGLCVSSSRWAFLPDWRFPPQVGISTDAFPPQVGISTGLAAALATSQAARRGLILAVQQRFGNTSAAAVVVTNVNASTNLLTFEARIGVSSLNMTTIVPLLQTVQEECLNQDPAHLAAFGATIREKIVAQVTANQNDVLHNFVAELGNTTFSIPSHLLPGVWDVLSNTLFGVVGEIPSPPTTVKKKYEDFTIAIIVFIIVDVLLFFLVIFVWRAVKAGEDEDDDLPPMTKKKKKKKSESDDEQEMNGAMEPVEPVEPVEAVGAIEPGDKPAPTNRRSRRAFPAEDVPAVATSD